MMGRYCRLGPPQPDCNPLTHRVRTECHHTHYRTFRGESCAFRKQGVGSSLVESLLDWVSNTGTVPAPIFCVCSSTFATKSHGARAGEEEQGPPPPHGVCPTWCSEHHLHKTLDFCKCFTWQEGGIRKETGAYKKNIKFEDYI